MKTKFTKEINIEKQGSDDEYSESGDDQSDDEMFKTPHQDSKKADHTPSGA